MDAWCHWFLLNTVSGINELPKRSQILGGYTLRRKLWNPLFLQIKLQNFRVFTKEYSLQSQWPCNYNGTPRLCPDKGSSCFFHWECWMKHSGVFHTGSAWSSARILSRARAEPLVWTSCNLDQKFQACTENPSWTLFTLKTQLRLGPGYTVKNWDTCLKNTF